MAKLTLEDITSGFGSATLLNANNAAIEAALEKTLSRDGETPNTMSATLDMNSNRIINLPAPVSQSEPARLADVLAASGVQGVGGTAPIVSSGGLNPVISVGNFGTSASGVVPASGGGTANYLRADGAWAEPSSAAVASVSGTAPVVSSGGTTPAISINNFGSSTAGAVPASGGGTSNYLRADGTWVTPPGAGGGTVVSVGVATANGLAGTSSGGTDPVLTLTTSITGVLKGNGTAISAAEAGTDYVTPTGSGSGLTSLTAANISSGNLGSGVLPYATASATASAFAIPFLNTTGVASGNFGLLLDSATGPTYNPSTNTLSVDILSPSSIELGHASDTTLSRVSAGVLAVEGVNVLTTATGVTTATGMIQGLATIPIMAAAMIPSLTLGALPEEIEATTNDQTYKVLSFDTTTQEFAHFQIPFPKSWNRGTVTFQPIWTAASGSGGVVWALEAVAIGNDDAIDTSWGTAQTSTDTLLAAGDIHVGPTSAAITIAGTPAEGDLVFFRVKRVPADGSDTLGVDARLIGLRLFFTQNASSDA